jgi:precorrin-6B methylase 2
MAELSKETLAILDRLKREGALTRNATTGNSIKQIMGKLDKFSVVFENINTQIAQMNKTFGQMLGANPSTFVGPLPSRATFWDICKLRTYFC